MENITPEPNFPILEQSSNNPPKRLVSYAIYINNSPLYPNHKYVLLKFISFAPSTIIQRDEGFSILFDNLSGICYEMVMQGFAMFMPSPGDAPGLVRSFI